MIQSILNIEMYLMLLSKKLKNSAIYTIISTILLIFALQIHAEALPKLFQVELIAFEINSASNKNNEYFPAYPLLPDYTDSQPLATEEDESQTFRSLGRTALKLRREENLISKKADYQILLHESWLQNDTNIQKVLLDTSQAPEQTSLLKGTIQVKKGYYYYVDLHLELRPNNSVSSHNENTHYVLNTKRRLKSNELNYIDHPKFGVLIEIFPVS